VEVLIVIGSSPHSDSWHHARRHHCVLFHVPCNACAGPQPRGERPPDPGQSSACVAGAAPVAKPRRPDTASP
jgi:hypothetical protein